MSFFSKLNKIDSDFDAQTDALNEAMHVNTDDFKIVGVDPDAISARLVKLGEIASARITEIKNEITRLHDELLKSETVYAGIVAAVDSMYQGKNNSADPLDELETKLIRERPAQVDKNGMIKGVKSDYAPETDGHA